MYENDCITSKNRKVVLVEYLYLDLNTSERCVRTQKVLEYVLDELRHAFKIAGYALEYHKVLIETAEMATTYKFLSSPTIRVNGRDICRFAEETYEVPSSEMIAEAIIQWSLVPKTPYCCLDNYVLPDNLKKFFDGK